METCKTIPKSADERLPLTETQVFEPKVAEKGTGAQVELRCGSALTCRCIVGMLSLSRLAPPCGCMTNAHRASGFAGHRRRGFRMCLNDRVLFLFRLC